MYFCQYNQSQVKTFSVYHVVGSLIVQLIVWLRGEGKMEEGLIIVTVADEINVVAFVRVSLSKPRAIKPTRFPYKLFGY